MSRRGEESGIWVGQALHVSLLAALLGLVYLAWSMIGRPCPLAFWSAVAVPVLHQVYVWLAWRLELRSGAISKSLGFKGYVVLFFLLFGGRFITLLALGLSDRGSLNLDVVPRVILTTLLALPGIYTMYSVTRYFGMARAAGADHFDARYREMPRVTKGIYRFTSNGMYLYAFLLFWALAVGLNSLAAVVIAAFSHAYIWVHYYATEKPDIDALYQTDGKSPPAQ
jgi:hypothetical protein